MISPREFRALMPVDCIEQHIDDAIKDGATLLHSIITIQVKAGWARHAVEGVLDKYRSAGWSAKVVDDWRDGDYIELMDTELKGMHA